MPKKISEMLEELQAVISKIRDLELTYNNNGAPHSGRDDYDDFLDYLDEMEDIVEKLRVIEKNRLDKIHFEKFMDYLKTTPFCLPEKEWGEYLDKAKLEANKIKERLSE